MVASPSIKIPWTGCPAHGDGPRLGTKVPSAYAAGFYGTSSFRGSVGPGNLAWKAQTVGGSAIGGSPAPLATAAHTSTQSMARSNIGADGGGGAHPEACAVLPRGGLCM